MKLHGRLGTSFRLDQVSTSSVGGVQLEPGVFDPHTSYAVAPSRTWSTVQVENAAGWWSDLVAGLNALDGSFTWLGPGVGFGAFVGAEDGLVAINVVVMKSLDDPRPAFDGTDLDMESDDLDMTYVTIDITDQTITDAAQWWRHLLLTM
jgi:hypothetical protein